MQNLLSRVHPGFSVLAGPPVEASEIASLESQARHITRPVLAMDALEKQADGKLVLETPPDPRTGATSIELDPLEWIHRITSHIPLVMVGATANVFFEALTVVSGFVTTVFISQTKVPVLKTMLSTSD